MSIRVIVLCFVVAAVGLSGCGSSGSSSGFLSAAGPGTSMTSRPATPPGCPVAAAAVSAALKMTMVAASTTEFQVPEAAICAFQTAANPGLGVQIYAFPFKAGREKNRGLASIKADLRAGTGKSASLGLTYRITEHPEWGTDAFSLLEYNSGQARDVQVWTTKYSCSIEDDSDQLSDADYLADAKNLGDAVVAASK